jgi:LEA14-like dessication related protein
MRGKGLMIVGLIAGLAGIGFGIYALYRRQIYMAMQYCYKLQKIIPKSFTKDNISMEIWMKILNRSTFALIIKSYSFDIFLNNNFISKIENDQDTIINPQSVNIIKVNLSIKPANILKGQLLLDLVTYYLIDQSRIVIKVMGNLFAQTNFIKIKLPINYQSNFKELTAPADPAKENDKLICPKEF